MPALSVDTHRDLTWHWNSVLGRLRVELNPRNFEAWLEGSSAAKLEGNLLLVEARSAFMCEWLNERLVVVVERAVANIFERELQVRFVPRGSAGSGDGPAASNEMREPDERRGGGALVGSLNGSYTFERYLPAEGNRLAYESCAALLDDEDFSISPVVVFGSPGMGKTHLLHAVASKATSRGRSVACVSAEQFANRYLGALRGQRMTEFQSEMRGVQLLIIDDLQYLAGRKGTQDELVHTIDAVTTSGGHVVIASEVHPLAMDLPERLASRLSAGIVTRVEPFVLEERKAYIERLSRDARVGLPSWAVERIAGCEVPSVRILQGAVHAAVMLQKTGRLDLRELDARLLHLTINAHSPGVLDDRATLDLIARHFDVTFEELVGRSRKATVGEARAVAAVALRARGRSLSEVATVLGGRDKTTVKAICTRGQEILDAEPRLKAQLAS